MKVKILRKVTGIPSATVATSPGATDLGMPQVTIVVSAIDSWQCSDVVARLALSASEARALAAELIRQADAAAVLARGVLGYSKPVEGLP